MNGKGGDINRELILIFEGGRREEGCLRWLRNRDVWMKAFSGEHDFNEDFRIRFAVTLRHVRKIREKVRFVNNNQKFCKSTLTTT
jgi:hypothetical protein